MKTAVVWILLALVPFANLQMICVDHGSASGVGAGSSPAPDCTEFCLREDAPRAAPQPAEGGCVLVAGGCSLLAALVVALPEPALGFDAPMENFDSSVPPVRTRYVSPVLQQLTPPPRA